MDIIINHAGALKDHQPIPALGNFYHQLFACLGYADEQFALADLLRQYHQLKGRWLMVSPIHWQATHNDAMIMAAGDELAWSVEESRQCFDVFSRFVHEDGMTALYHDKTTWLLRCDGKPEMNAVPVHGLLHQSLMKALQQLDSTLFWQRFLTETQMLFNTQPLNQSLVNGVWIWGAGSLPAPVHKPIVVSSERLHQLASLLSTEVLNEKSISVYPKNSILLFESLAEPEREALQSRVAKERVHWYWNNIAYTTKPPSLWSRLMENLSRAN